MDIKKGQLITFSEGDYSDYCVIGLCVALKDFNLDEVKRFWELENTNAVDCSYRHREIKILNDDAIDFLPFICRTGLVEDVDYAEVHTGTYEVSVWREFENS